MEVFKTLKVEHVDFFLQIYGQRGRKLIDKASIDDVMTRLFEQTPNNLDMQHQINTAFQTLLEYDNPFVPMGKMVDALLDIRYIIMSQDKQS